MPKGRICRDATLPLFQIERKSSSRHFNARAFPEGSEVIRQVPCDYRYLGIQESTILFQYVSTGKLILVSAVFIFLERKRSWYKQLQFLDLAVDLLIII